MRIDRWFLLAALVALARPAPAAGQIVRDLDPIELRYRIRLNDDPDPIGEARASFRVVDTERGARLHVDTVMEYTLGSTNPVPYHEEVRLVCDERGPLKFEAVVRRAATETKHTGLRVGSEIHVTSRTGERTRKRTIPASTSRTNIGLFAGAFLEPALDEGPLFENFPLLVPAIGDQRPRQRIREGVVPAVSSSGEKLRVIVTTLRRPDRSADRCWHRADGHQELLRYEEEVRSGTRVFELVEVNGEPTDLGTLFP